MRERKQLWALTAPIGGLIVAITSACTAPLDEASDPANEAKPATQREPLLDGTVTHDFGVVDFFVGGSASVTEGHYSCTGSMIGPNAVLTAAHCFDGWASGPVPVTIRYFDPVHGTRIVFDGTATLDKMGNPYSSFPARAPFDIAVILIPGVFPGTDYHDYKRLFAGGDSALSNTLTFYGAGINDPLFGKDPPYSIDDNNVRVAPLSVESVNASLITTDNGPVAVCHGDSGGPLIKVASTPGHANSLELVTGVLSYADFENGTDACASTSSDPFQLDNAYFARPDLQYFWVGSAIGHACTLLSGASESYRRCFDLPFIEDVDFEGPSLGEEVAMAMSSAGNFL